MSTKKNKYELKGKMFLWSGDKPSWHFMPIDKKVSTQIKKDFSGNTAGFGSLPVRVQLGTSDWKTSIFPDSKSGTYVLPIKKKVRSTEDIEAGEMVKFTIKIGG